jgi:hypothetical protein
VKLKKIDKKAGYSVGAGELTKSEQTKIRKLKLSIGTYEIESLKGFDIGIW